jgi:predicted O-linked N-acetylglucosamine transferase (SPINDLY family)
MAIEGRPLVVKDLRSIYAQGLEAHAAGRLDEAEPAYRAILARDPANVAAHAQLGMLLRARRRLEPACDSYRRAIALAPQNDVPYGNLGRALRELGRRDQALIAFARAARIKPGSADILSMAANLLAEIREFARARRCARMALALRPDLFGAHLNLGNAEKGLGRPRGAIASIRRALAIDPVSALAHNSVASAFRDDGMASPAIAGFRRTLVLQPDAAFAHSNLIFALDFAPARSAADIQRECRRWYGAHARKHAASATPHANTPEPDRRLRIGYVSADLRQHSAAYGFSPLLLAYDRARFDVTCYSNTEREDEYSAHLRRSVDRWRLASAMTDEALVAAVRQDGIDILVDLSGHTAGNRLLAFARKPAPVQVTVMGTGVREIDHLLSDPVLIPPAEQAWYTEQVTYLEHQGETIAFNAYSPLPGLPPVGPLPALQAGHVTFGCLNRFSKMSDAALALWAEILRHAPAARLLLKAAELDDAPTRDRIVGFFGARGVDARRLDLRGRTSLNEHLGTCHEIDLALDPFPHGGGITTLEMLWMGVPAITLRGDTISGRTSTAVQAPLGLHDVIARTPEGYRDAALRLSADLPALASRRAGLRPRMAASPAAEPRLYAAAVERAYRAMWRRWCARR